MIEAHAYIIGDIIPDQGAVSDYGFVNLTDFVASVNSQGKFDKLIVHIHSRGGSFDEGFAIYDYLINLKRQGKIIETSVEGWCASIATVPLMAGSIRKCTPNSQILIHLPKGGGEGTADDIQKMADYVRNAENKLADFYAKHLGVDRGMILDILSQDKPMPLETALEMKILTEISEDILVSNFLTLNTQKQMSKEKTGILASIKKEIADLRNLVFGDITNKDFTTADGSVLQIETENEAPAVGDVVSIDGAPAPDGDYLMPEGETLVVVDSKITEIKPKEETTPTEEEIEAMQTELNTLRAQVRTYEGLKAEIVNLKKDLVSSGYKPKAGNIQNRKKEEDPEKTPAQKAAERRAQKESK